MTDKEPLGPFARWLWKRLEEKLSKVSIKTIAGEIRVSHGTLLGWLHHNALPRRGSVRLLARYFDVPEKLISELAAQSGGALWEHRVTSTVPDRLEDPELNFARHAIHLFMRLNRSQRESVLAFIERINELKSERGE